MVSLVMPTSDDIGAPVLSPIQPLTLDRNSGVGDIRQLEWVETAGSRFVCSLTADGAVHVWVPGSDQPLAGVRSAQSRIQFIQGVSPLDGMIVALCENGRLIGIQAPNLKQQFVLEHGDADDGYRMAPRCHAPTLLSWNARTRTLLVTDSKSASFWALDKRQLIARLKPTDFDGKWGRFASIAVSPRKPLLIASGITKGESDVSGPAMAMTFTGNTRKLWQPLPGNGPQCRNIYFSESGEKLILTAPTEVPPKNGQWESEVASLWDLEKRSKIRDFKMRDKPHGYSAQFVLSGDERFLAGQVGVPVNLLLWDTNISEPLRNYGPTWSIPSGGYTITTEMRFSKSGQMLFAKKGTNLIAIQLKSLEMDVFGRPDRKFAVRYSNVWDLPVSANDEDGAAAVDGRIRFLKVGR